MSLKKTVLSVASAAVMLSPLAGGVHAATVNCSSNKTTVVTVVNSNTTISSQTVVQNNSTGGNTSGYNVLGGTIFTGSAGSLANLSFLGGSNRTLLNLGGGSTTNVCNVVNTGF